MDLHAFVSALQEHGAHAAEAGTAASGQMLGVWLIPLLPVFGFLFQTFIGRKLPKPVVGFVSCGVVLASCLLSSRLFFKVQSSHETVIALLGPWVHIPGLKD